MNNLHVIFTFFAVEILLLIWRGMVLTIDSIAALVSLCNAVGLYEDILMLLLDAINVFILLFDVAFMDDRVSSIFVAAERPVCNKSMFRSDHLSAHGRPIIQVA